MRQSSESNARGSGGPSILLYHSIAAVTVDPWGLRVDPRNFAAHIRLLRARANPIRLCDVDRWLAGGDLPPRSVAVTFDDGYADNLLAAAPILNRCGVPATVFIATGYIGAHAEYWWDDLERIVLEPARGVTTLHGSIRGREHRWSLSDSLSERWLRSRRLRRWRAWQTDRLSARQSTLVELWRILRELEPDQRDLLLDELRSQAGHDCAPRATHRPLTHSELRELAADQAIEIGAHTHRHPSLGLLNPALQGQEIEHSRQWLEAELGCAITSFAIPFGTLADYSIDTLESVRRAGFARCVTTQGGVVGRAANPMALPRFNVSNWSGDEFAERLERWFAVPSEPAPSTKRSSEAFSRSDLACGAIQGAAGREVRA